MKAYYRAAQLPYKSAEVSFARQVAGEFISSICISNATESKQAKLEEYIRMKMASDMREAANLYCKNDDYYKIAVILSSSIYYMLSYTYIYQLIKAGILGTIKLTSSAILSLIGGTSKLLGFVAGSTTAGAIDVASKAVFYYGSIRKFLSMNGGTLTVAMKFIDTVLSKLFPDICNTGGARKSTLFVDSLSDDLKVPLAWLIEADHSPNEEDDIIEIKMNSLDRVVSIVQKKLQRCKILLEQSLSLQSSN